MATSPETGKVDPAEKLNPSGLRIKKLEELRLVDGAIKQEWIDSFAEYVQQLISSGRDGRVDASIQLKNLLNLETCIAAENGKTRKEPDWLQGKVNCFNNPERNPLG
ncbi:MAG: hypothetical protein ABIH35_02290 [Patescibacteria group bacterium]